MLNPWIIEEILRREREQRERDHARIELPLEAPNHQDRHDQPAATPPAETERGVLILDI